MVGGGEERVVGWSWQRYGPALDAPRTILAHLALVDERVVEPRAPMTKVTRYYEKVSRVVEEGRQETPVRLLAGYDVRAREGSW